MVSQAENGSYWIRNWLRWYLRHGPDMTRKQRETLRSKFLAQLSEQSKAQELLELLAAVPSKSSTSGTEEPSTLTSSTPGI